MVPASRLRKTRAPGKTAMQTGIFPALLLALGFAAVPATLLIGAVPARAADIDWSKAETVTLAMSEYQFTPNALAFKRGTAYRLHLVNQGRELHELDGPQFFAAITVGNPELLVNGGKEVDVKPGQSQDLLFVPNQAGKFPIDCDDHEVFGMTATFTVE
jgi:uncharacterized cupredoxin-like copper-binding protein